MLFLAVNVLSMKRGETTGSPQEAVVTSSGSGYGLLTCLFLMILGNSISKYWIYKWVYVSNFQTRNISADFTQTVPSEKQASSVGD